MFILAKNWFELLKDEFEKDYYKNLTRKLETEYNTYKIYPPAEQVFSAFNMVKYDDVKVVIIGQDPYHEPNQAHGLCFSVQDGVEVPRSLCNIYKELADDCGCTIPKRGNLTKWAKQGVLLLNSVLTVRAGCANSHRNFGWEIFIAKILDLLNKREKPIIFLLWGNNAKEVGKMIDENKHFVLKAAHPSPLSANNGFFGCKHFSKANKIIEEVLHEKPIDWQIEDCE